MPPPPVLRHTLLHEVARRFLNPVVVRLGLAGSRYSPIGLVLHVGRRSGHVYATPLAIHRRRNRLVVPLTYGPAAHWCRNVFVADGCRVRLGGREYQVFKPQVVSLDSLPPSMRRAYRLVGMRAFLQLTLVDPSRQRHGTLHATPAQPIP